jgi:DNA-directed RNA polymerase beta' subunit
VYPDDQQLADVKLKTSLLEKDILQSEKVLNKLSDSIQKIQELNVNVMQMLTMHESKHQHHTEAEEELKEDYKELHSRITTVNRELHERIDQVERHITERIDALRSDLVNHKKEDTEEKGLDFFEKWKYIILCALLIVGYIGGQLNSAQVIGLIK